MSNTFCPEAIHWCLRQISFKDLVALYQIIPALKNVLTRGGFTINAKNYRQENTERRLMNTLQRRDDLAQALMMALARVHRERETAQGGRLDCPASYALFEEHWREKFSTQKDARPLAVAFYHDLSHPRLARMCDLLMQSPSFWKTGKVLPRGKAAATRQERAACMSALENLLSQKSQQQTDSTATTDPLPLSAPKMVQPALPGLLPLIPTQKAAPSPTMPSQKTHPQKADSADNPEIPSGNAESPLQDAASLQTVSEDSRNSTHQLQKQAITATAPAHEGILPLRHSTTDASEDEVEKLKADLARARQRNGELSRENDALRKESRKQQGLHEKELVANSKENQALKKELEEIKLDFDDAIDELREEFGQAQTTQMAAFYAETLGIHPDQLAFLYEAQSTNQNLLGRVDKALAKQFDVDKKSGTIQKLRNLERGLDQQLSRVRAAVENAIVVTPGLLDLEKELEEKLSDIRRQLRKGTEEGETSLDGIVPRVVAYAKELPLQAPDTLDRLQEVLAFLDSPMGLRVFSPGEAHSLRACVEERKKLVERSAGIALEYEKIPQDPSPALGERMVNITRLSWYVDQMRNAELLIDGYNVIKQDPILSVKEKAANGFQSVRGEFIERCRRCTGNFRKVTLVFDGDLPTDNIIQKGDNFVVVYVGKKTADQNADNWIIQRLSELDAQQDASEGVHQWIVTNDHGLRARAAELCDGCVDNATFMAFLG